jgi:hypothetical protein
MNIAVFPEKKRKGRGRAQKTLDIIKASIEILEEIQPATVRGVCYRLFVRGLIAHMGKGETQKVSRILTNARERGEVHWDWIVDETRQREWTPQWRDLTEFAETIPGRYRRDFWAHQPETIEIWSEKGTVRGILGPVLDEFGVTFSCKHGFDSATIVHETVELTKDLDRPLIALYVGDWDPSGLCMSEVDLPRRLEAYGANVDLRRLALTRADTLSGLPSFDAETKEKDPRYKWFRREYGAECWELDAMDPRDLRERVRNAILHIIDQDAWEECQRLEEQDRAILGKVDWSRVFSDQAQNTPPPRPRPKPPRPRKRKLGYLTPKRVRVFSDQRKNTRRGRK